jgi:hypothetical protein
MNCKGSVAEMDETKGAYHKVKHHFGALVLDGRITLKLIS